MVLQGNGQSKFFVGQHAFTPDIWQHTAHIEQFLTAYEDSTTCRKFYGKDLEPECLQIHRAISSDIAKQNQKSKTSENSSGYCKDAFER